MDPDANQAEFLRQVIGELEKKIKSYVEKLRAREALHYTTFEMLRKAANGYAVEAPCTSEERAKEILEWVESRRNKGEARLHAIDSALWRENSVIIGIFSDKEDAALFKTFWG